MASGAWSSSSPGLRGAQVIATASPANHDVLRDLGRHPVAYGHGLLDRVEAAPAETGPVTVAIDTVGTDEALDTSVELVADRSADRDDRGVRPSRRAAASCCWANGPGADPGTAIREAARHARQLAADGRLDVRVARTYPLEDAAAAHQDGQAGHAAGKLVLLP